MATSKLRQREIDERRRRVSELYLRAVRQVDIADELDVTQGTISTDIAWLRKQWREEFLHNVDERVSDELARIDELERVAWEAWERSVGEVKQSTTERVGRDLAAIDEGARGIQREKLVVHKRDQAGDPAFLARVAWCIQRRCELLGLDSPQRHELTGSDGAPVELIVAFPHRVAQVVEEDPDGDS